MKSNLRNEIKSYIVRQGMTMQEDGKNYGDFLLDTVEAAKEQFTDKEYEWLKESATEISNIENLSLIHI